MTVSTTQQGLKISSENAQPCGLGLIRLAGITKIKRTLEHIAADRGRILPIVAAAVRLT